MRGDADLDEARAAEEAATRRRLALEEADRVRREAATRGHRKMRLDELRQRVVQHQEKLRDLAAACSIVAEAWRIAEHSATDLRIELPPELRTARRPFGEMLGERDLPHMIAWELARLGVPLGSPARLMAMRGYKKGRTLAEIVQGKIDECDKLLDQIVAHGTIPEKSRPEEAA